MAAVAIIPLNTAGRGAGRSSGSAAATTLALTGAGEAPRPRRGAATTGADGSCAARPARPLAGPWWRPPRCAHRARPGPRPPRRARGELDRLAELRQVGQHLRGRLIPIARVLGHQLHDQPVDLHRQVGAVDQQAAGDLAHLLQGHRDRGIAAERGHRRQHEVIGRTQRVEVAAVIQRVPLGLLGAHVGRGPHRDPHLGQVRAVSSMCAAQAEIGDLHPPPPGDQDVLGLDVAVDQAGLAGRPDRLRRLLHDRDRLQDVEQRPACATYSRRLVPSTYSMAM